jgi:hypothetical protein
VKMLILFEEVGMFGTLVLTTLVLLRLIIPIAVIILVGTAIKRHTSYQH